MDNLVQKHLKLLPLFIMLMLGCFNGLHSQCKEILLFCPRLYTIIYDLGLFNLPAVCPLLLPQLESIRSDTDSPLKALVGCIVLTWSQKHSQLFLDPGYTIKKRRRERGRSVCHPEGEINGQILSYSVLFVDSSQVYLYCTFHTTGINSMCFKIKASKKKFMHDKNKTR